MPTNSCEIDSVSSSSLLNSKNEEILNATDKAKYTNLMNYFMGEIFRNNLMKENLTISDLTSNETNVNETYKNIRFAMLKFLEDNRATLSKKVIDDIEKITSKDNWRIVKDYHNLNNNIVVSEVDFIKGTDDDDYNLEDIDGVIDSGEETPADSVPQSFRERGNEESTFDVMSSEIRTMFKLLPKSKITFLSETDIKIEQEFDEDGLPMVADFDNIFNLLSERLAGTNNYTDFKDKLESINLTKIIPEMKYLNEMLGLNKQDLNTKQTVAIVNFHKVFSRPMVEIWSSLYKVGAETKEFLYFKNTKGNKRKIQDSIINNFISGNIDDAVMNAHTMIDDSPLGLGRRRLMSIPEKPMRIDYKNVKNTSTEALNFLQLIGYRFSGFDLLNDSIEKEEFATAINFTVDQIHNGLSSRLGAGVVIYNPFEELYKSSKDAANRVIKHNRSHLRDLINLESKYSKLAPTLSSKNVDGENQYEISQHNAITIAAYYLNKAQTIEELLDSPPFLNLKYNPLFNASYYKSILFDNDGKKKYTVDKYSSNLIPMSSVKVRNYNGFEIRDEKYMTRSLAVEDKFVLDFFNLTQEGAINTLQLESKNSAYSIHLLNKDGFSVLPFGKEAFEYGFSSTSAFSRRVFEYMRAEVARIKSFPKKLKENPGLAGRGEDKSSYEQFSLMSEIVSDPELREKLINAENLTPTSPEGRLFMSALEKYFNGKVKGIKDFADANKIDLNELVSSKIVKNYGEVFVSDDDTEETGTKGKPDINLLLSVFVANSFIINSEFTIYFAPDPLFLSDYHKRLGMVASTGSLTSTIDPVNKYLESDEELTRNASYALAPAIEAEMRDNSKTYYTAVLKEMYDPTNDYATEMLIDGFMASLATKKITVTREEAYALLATEKAFETAVGDGQGYISIDFHRELSLRQGFWTENLEIAYRYEGLVFRQQEGLASEEELSELETFEQIIISDPGKYAIPTLKYTTMSPIVNATVNMIAGDKFSLHPLRPSFTKNHPRMNDLHKAMIKRQIGYVKFKSGTKLSTRHQFKDIEDLANSDVEPDLLATELLKEQLKTKINQKTESIIPTQFIKLLFSNLFDEGEAFTPKAAKLRQDFINFLTQIRDEQAVSLYKKLGFTMNPNGTIKNFDPENLVAKIKDEISRQKLNSNILESIQLKDGKFVYDLEASGAMRQIMDYLTGSIDKFLRRYKTNQADFVLVSSAYQSEAQYYDNQNIRTKKLRYMGYNKEGDTHMMECRITLTGEFAKLLNLPDPGIPGQNIRSFDRLNELLKDKDFVKRNKRSLTVVFSRVPIQSPGSMGTAIITEFIFPTAGNVLQLPVEFMHQAGIDFDYDKEKVMMPNISDDGHYVPHDLSGIEDEIQKLKAERDNLIKDIRSNKQVENNSINAVKVYIKAFKDDLFKNNPYLTSADISDQKIKSIGLTFTEARTILSDLYDRVAALEEIKARTKSALKEIAFIHREDEDYSTFSDEELKEYRDNEKEHYAVIEEIDTLLAEFERIANAIVDTELHKVVGEGKKYAKRIKQLATLKYLKKESLVNKFTDLCRQVLTLPELFSEIVLPNNNNVIKKIANDNGQDLDIMATLPQKGQVLDYMANLNVFNIYYTAKALLAPFALTNTFHQLVTQQNTRANYEYNLGDVEKVGTPIKIHLTLLNNTERALVLRREFDNSQYGKAQVTLASIKDVEQNVIQYLISQIINATVDSAKDPYFAELRQSWDNVNETTFMLHLRYPMDRIVQLTNAPLVMDFTNHLKRKVKRKFALNAVLQAYGITVAEPEEFLKDIEAMRNVVQIGFSGVNYDTNLSDVKVLRKLKKIKGSNLKLADSETRFITQDTFDQVRLLAHFYMMGLHSAQFRGFKSLFNNDTNKTTSLLQTYSKARTEERLIKKGMFTIQDIMSFKRNSIITPFRNDHIVDLILKNRFPTLSNPDVLGTINSIFSKYSGQAGSGSANRRILPTVIENDLVHAIFATYGKYKGFNVTEYGKNLIGKTRDVTTLIERLSAFRKTDFYKTLTKEFSVLEKFRGEPSSKTISNSLYSKVRDGVEELTIPHNIVFVTERNETIVQQESYINQINTLLTRDFGEHTELIQELMKDIFIAGLIQSGTTDVGIGFNRFIPTSFKAPLIQAAFNEFKRLYDNEKRQFLSLFEDQFPMNNSQFFPDTPGREQDTHLGKPYNLVMTPDENLMLQPERVYGTKDNPYILQMVYEYGGNRRDDVTAFSTLEAIRRGERTATTRYTGNSELRFLTKAAVGDFILMQGQGGKDVLTVVTKELYRLDEAGLTAEEWSKLEGWSVDYYERTVLPKLDRAYQIQFEVYKEPTDDNDGGTPESTDPNPAPKAPAEVLQPGFAVFKNALTQEQHNIILKYAKDQLAAQGYHVKKSVAYAHWGKMWAVNDKGNAGFPVFGKYLRKDIDDKIDLPVSPITSAESVDDPNSKGWYNYYETDQNGRPLPEIPQEIKDIIKQTTGYDVTDHDAAIINAYGDATVLTRHIDNTEDTTARGKAIVSINLINPGTFFYGNGSANSSNRNPDNKETILTEKDIAIFGGQSRFMPHRVDVGSGNTMHIDLADGTSGIDARRINITIRRVMPIAQKPQNLLPAKVEKQQSSIYAESFGEITNHSGGAKGADSTFDAVGKSYGQVKHNHYYHGDKTPMGNVHISEQDFEEGRYESAKAAKRNFGYKYATMKDDRLIRNWAQVKHSDSVIAIGNIVQPGERLFPDIAGDTRVALEPSVTGGTGYAVAMAKNHGKPIFVFNQKDVRWYAWSHSDNEFFESDVPVLTKNFAGIGSRNITAAGVQAIKDVYENTKNSFSSESPFDTSTNEVQHAPKVNDMVKLIIRGEARTGVSDQRITSIQDDVEGNEWIMNLIHEKTGNTIEKIAVDKDTLEVSWKYSDSIYGKTDASIEFVNDIVETTYNYKYFGRDYVIKVSNGVGVDVVDYKGRNVNKQRLLDAFNNSKQDPQSIRADVETSGTTTPSKVEAENVFLFKDGTAINTPFELNDQQANALYKMEEFVKNPSSFNDQITLLGYAGTGKTSIMGIFDKYLATQYIVPYYSAPTHRANAVTKLKNPKAKVLTLHSLFGLSGLFNLEDGDYDLKDIKFAAQNKPKVTDGDYIIIDEASMVSTSLYAFIESFKEELGIKVIYVGDPAQLKPVKEKKVSPVFSKGTQLQLTKVERTGDNAILEESTNLRNNKDFNYQTKIKNNIGVQYLNVGQEIRRTIDQNFKSEDFKNNKLYFRILSAKNQQVTAANKLVREMLFKEPGQLMLGDILMGYDNFDVDYHTKEPLIVNSGDYLVEEISPFTKQVNGVDYKGFNVVLSNLLTKNDPRKNIFIVDNTESDAKIFAFIEKVANLNREGAKAMKEGNGKRAAQLFSEAREMQSNLAFMKALNDENGKLKIKKTLDYGYAHTIHKSQGGTYTKVYVISDTIDNAFDEETQQQLKYVAMSRATDMVYVQTSHKLKPAIIDNSEINIEWKSLSKEVQDKLKGDPFLFTEDEWDMLTPEERDNQIKNCL